MIAKPLHVLLIATLAILVLILAACVPLPFVTPTPTSVDTAPAPPTSTPEPDTVEVLAPVDEVQILTAESFPPQYFVLVKVGLPNGCTAFDRSEVERGADEIRITVINREQVGVFCTQEYRSEEHTVSLGSDFEPGRQYTVVVNDVVETFVAQGEAAPPPPSEALLRTPFVLAPGQTAVVRPPGLVVEFVRVTEDSRCPTGANCAWAGRAMILISVSSRDDTLGFGMREMLLEEGRLDPDSNGLQLAGTVYVFDLLDLEPYPSLDQQQEPDYRATLMVTEREVSAPATPTSPPATATSAPAPTNTPVPTATSIPAPTPTPCSVRTDWIPYTVVRGDTLFNISQRSGSSVNELMRANCLSSVDIRVGQRLYVPNPIEPTATPTPTPELVEVYLIAPEDGGMSGPPVGCGDSAVPVRRPRQATGFLLSDVRASLEELFAIDTLNYGESGLQHSLYDADIEVESVSLLENRLEINLTGSMPLIGTCSDARMEAQILLTVFQYEGFGRTLIRLNGRSLKQVFDLSGLVGPNEPYERSSVTW